MRGRLERLEHKFSEPDVPADLPLTEEQRWERITLLLAHCDSGEATDDEQRRASTIRYVLKRAKDRQQREHVSAATDVNEN